MPSPFIRNRTTANKFKVRKIVTDGNGMIKEVRVAEGTVLTHILGYLIHNDYFHTRLNSGAVFTMQRRYVRLAPAGYPDIIGILNDGSGRFFGIEVKKKGSYQSPQQKKIQAEMLGKNGVYVIARSVSDVITAFEEIEQK